MGNIGWHFALNNGGEETGPNDTASSNFKDKSISVLVREIIQNSIDARKNNNEPVRVVFSLENIRIDDIPAVYDLSYALDKTGEYYSDIEKWKEFCESAQKVLSKGECAILRVGDYNTFGLRGKDDYNKGSLYKLTRAIGVNSSTGAGGGSYGIGKSAPFESSNIRTVLYSTFNDDGEYIFTGSSRLACYKDDKGKIRRGTGYLGKVSEEGAATVREFDRIPSMFRRTEQGTDVVILCYEDKSSDLEETGDWKRSLVKATHTNIWLAIYEMDLVVEFRKEGEAPLVINADTLKTVIDDFHGTYDGDSLGEDAWFYHDAVINHDNEDVNIYVPCIGLCRIYLRLKEDYPRLVQRMRAPKILVDCGRPQIKKGYAGLFICENPEGNKVLQSLEPPAHNNWDNKNVKNADNVRNQIRLALRNALLNILPREQGEVVDIPGLSDYLPYDDNDDSIFGSKEVSGTDSESDNFAESAKERVEIRPQTFSSRPLSRRASNMLSNTETGGGHTPSTAGSGTGEPGGMRSGKGPGQGHKETIIRRITFRYSPDRNNSNKITAMLVSDKNIDGYIGFAIVGDDYDYPLTPKSASIKGDPLEIKGSRISVKLSENKLTPVVIEFKEEINNSKLGLMS